MKGVTEFGVTKPTTVLKPDSFRLPLTSTAITTSCFAMHVGSGGQSCTLHSVDSKRSGDLARGAAETRSHRTRNFSEVHLYEWCL